MDLKLTTRSQEAMAAAVRRAATDGHAQVEPAHLLAALLAQTDTVTPALLRDGRRRPRRPCAAPTDAALRGPAAASGASVSTPALGARRTRRCPPRATSRASWGTSTSPTEHLLIGLAAGDGQNEAPGSVAAALAASGATRSALLAALPGVRGNARVTSPDPEGTTRRWRSTASTSPPRPATAGSTR